MRLLLKYLKSYRKETILAPLFKMLEASFELFIPLVMASVIDRGIGQKDNLYVWKMGAVLLALGLIGLTCAITAQYFAARAATGFSKELRKALFVHIQSLSYSRMDQIKTSTLITRMTSDVNQVQSGVNLVLRLFLRSPFIVFGAMIMAFTVNRKAAMIFVVTIPLLSLVVFGIMLITMPLYKKVQAQLDEVLRLTRENLLGVRVIRAFHKEEEEIQRFETSNQILNNAQQFVGKISAVMNPVTFVVVNGATILLIYTGALQVDAGILTQGEVVALVNYMSQILVELVKLANLIITVTKAFACGNRIAAVFAEESEIRSGDMIPEFSGDFPVVEFSHVDLCYENAGQESLEDISFCAKMGETIGVIGGTGCGKSSLVNLIPRFYETTGGNIRIGGVDIKELDTTALREQIGVVPQKAVLFAGTIEDNLRWGNENASVEELEEALRIAQAEEFVKEKEGYLSFWVEQNGRNLSGGQRQRLTIARAVVRKPKILILDDSASALDYATDAKLRAALQKIAGKMTVFIVSQRASSLLYADQILVLDDGKVAGHGTHEQLLETCPEYREIYESQFEKKGGR